LTELEFSDADITFKQISFIQTDLYFEKSNVDAAISNQDHLKRLINNNIDSRPLSQKVIDKIGNRDTSAALVIRAGENSVSQVLKTVLDPEQIINIQQQVEMGLIVPRY
jgi:hypothetical protein